MNKRQWIAIAFGPVWIFALRFAWLEAAPMSRDIDDWLFTTRVEQPPACPTHYDIASARRQGLGDTEIADWFASGCPNGGPASPGEVASESPTAADWEAVGGQPQKPPPAPAWLKQSAVPSWAPKPQKAKPDPWTDYQHKPDGKGPTLAPAADPYAEFRPAPVVGQPRKRDTDHHTPKGVPVHYDPFKEGGNQTSSVVDTLRAAEASRSKRTADQPPSRDP